MPPKKFSTKLGDMFANPHNWPTLALIFMSSCAYLSSQNLFIAIEKLPTIERTVELNDSLLQRYGRDTISPSVPMSTYTAKRFDRNETKSDSVSERVAKLDGLPPIKFRN